MPHLRVCALDDDSVYRALIANTLRGAGHRVDIFPDAKSIDHAICRQSDVFLLDLLMPGDDGLDVLETLETAHYAGSVILVTGVDMEGANLLLERLLSSPLLIADILQKPFTAAQLTLAVRGTCSMETTIPFSTTTREILQRAIGARKFENQCTPCVDAGSGEIDFLVVDPGIRLGWTRVPCRNLAQLIVHCGLARAFLEALLPTLPGELERFGSAAHIPLVLTLPSVFHSDATAFAALMAALDVRPPTAVPIHFLLAEQDYLLHHQRLLYCIEALAARDCGIVLDQARSILRERYLPELLLFNAIRLGRAVRPTRDNMTLELLRRLHAHGVHVATSTPYAWLSLAPGTALAAELLDPVGATRHAALLLQDPT